MNLSTELPLYESIRRELLARIESGELREGDRIVPEIDLAKQLGVSRSTARKALQCLTDAGMISRTAGRGSFVLPQRGRGRFSSSRVLELAICPPESAGTGAELARGFLHESLQAGCAAVAWPWSAQAESWPNGASGGAVWACGDHGAAQTYLAQARRLSMPSVVIDAELAEHDCVTMDHAGLCRALAKGLLDRGHRSVAVLTGPQQSHCTRLRLDASRETFAQAGVQVPGEFVISGAPESRDMLRNDLLALLGRRDRPKALLCLHEGLSPWLSDSIEQLGYTLGEDLDLALTISGGACPAQCIVGTLDIAAAGAAAARMLLRRLDTPTLPAQRESIGYQLCAKELSARQAA